MVDITFQKCYQQFEYRFEEPVEHPPSKKPAGPSKALPWRRVESHATCSELLVPAENDFVPFDFDSSDEAAPEMIENSKTADFPLLVDTSESITEREIGNRGVGSENLELGAANAIDQFSPGNSSSETVTVTPSDLVLPNKLRLNLLLKVFGFSANDAKVRDA